MVSRLIHMRKYSKIPLTRKSANEKLSFKIIISTFHNSMRGLRKRRQSFQLGGEDQTPLVPSQLRGCPPRLEAGKCIATGALAYLAPIWYILRAGNTKPFSWNRLHGAAFADAYAVWTDEQGFSLNRLKVGVGLEDRFNMTLCYWLKIVPAIGLSYVLIRVVEQEVFLLHTLTS